MANEYNLIVHGAGYPTWLPTYLSCEQKRRPEEIVRRLTSDSVDATGRTHHRITGSSHGYPGG